jgi:transcriptional antiterminator
MSNIKLNGWDIIAIHIKRAFGWTINRLANNYKVTTRTIYRALKK